MNFWKAARPEFLYPDRDLDSFKKEFFIYCCDSYRQTRQSRMKHESPRRRFELSECFLLAVELVIAVSECIFQLFSAV